MAQRASDAERAYWRKIAEANERLRDDERPVSSLTEVFERMAAIRARLGTLAEPGLAADDERALAENVELRSRWHRKGTHVEQDP